MHCFHPSRHPALSAALLALPLLSQPLAAQEQYFSGGVDISDNALSDADLFVTDTSVLDGNVCIGNGCVEAEVFDADTLAVFKHTNVNLEFNDTSATTFPDRNWRLRVNDLTNIASGGLERFSIEDMTQGTIPFTLLGGAPDNALWVDEEGNLGLGTSLPQEELHIVGNGNEPALLLEDVGGSPGGWRLNGNDANFVIEQYPENTTPFFVSRGAPSASLAVTADGRIGIGTTVPDAPLEILDAASFSFFRLTAAHAAVNRSVDVVFTGGPLGTGQLRYNIVDGDNQEMSLDADGNMILDGTLTTGGPSCAGGCDAVFTEGQIIPERDYSAQMWAQGHLPHVGPTAPGEAFNMTEKMGGMLNALEHAHIYIDRQNARIETLEAQIADQQAEHARALAALTARLDALEQN